MAISAYKDVIVFPNDNSGRVNIKEQAFTASGTWTAPSGVTAAQVILVGAGGGGGGGSNSGAGGGGGGGVVAVQNISVTPGTAYQLNIGAGGQGGQSSLTGAGDYLSTLPGANGGTTTFGSTTVWNYLTNPDFDYNVLGWDPMVIYRAISGVSGQTTLNVFPNTTGLIAGMYVSGGSVGTNAQIVSISGNVITVSVANSSTVGTVGLFDIGDTVLAPANTLINAISAPNVDALTGVNTFPVNTPGSPFANSVTNSTTGQLSIPSVLSNNLLAPRLAQLEDITLVSGSFIIPQGTGPATTSITSAGMPAKIYPEMTGGLTTTATSASGVTQITVANSAGIYPNMYVFTTTGLGIASGTYVTFVQGSTVTLSAATTAVLSATSVYFSYNPTVGQNALLAVTNSSVNAAAPTWLNFSTINNTTNNTGSSSYIGGYQGIPWQPGATYTVSAYVSSNINVQTATPIIFQLRSAGNSYMAQSNVNYLGGTTVYTPNTNTIDAATNNGFFVRQGTASAMTGYGAAVSTTATGLISNTQITVASTAGILVGMTATAAGYITNGTTVSAISGNVVTLSNTNLAALSNISVTFAMPSGVQILGSTVTSGQTGWRRIYATITTPSISPTSTTATTGVYNLGATPQFIYPTVVLSQASTSFWFDNIQVELGSTPTTWQPPVMQQMPVLSASSQTQTNGDLETAHRPVRVIAGNAYAGSMYVVSTGNTNAYYPVTAFIEWLDADYNSLGRATGSNNFLPNLKVQVASQSSSSSGELVNYPVRIGVTATAPTGTVYARLGMSAYQGTTPGTTGVQYNVFFPVLESGSTFTQPKRTDNVNYFWAGQPGASQIISGWTLAAEGGGGGGTYNTNNYHWQYGLEGGNNGGHAAVNAYNTLTLAGGGGGSFQAGMPGTAWGQTTNGSTSSQVGTNTSSTAGIISHTLAVRGNLGGHALTDGGTNNPYIQAQGGDGGLGTVISGLTSGSPLGLALGGGGGGAGWGSSSAALTKPGRGNGGGGKGGGNYIVDEFNNQYYFSRGLDAIPNTGGGGGGGGSNQNNTPFTLLAHTSADRSLSMENWNQANYSWAPIYNAAVVQAGTPANISGGTYGMQINVGDSGNFKVATSWQEFPIMPRTTIYIPTFGARLQTAANGVQSPLFTGLNKRVRPTIRWKDSTNTIIREDRPGFDAIFTAITTNTYLGNTGTPSGQTSIFEPWLTLQAPANAYFFDITIEGQFFDGGDVVYVDFGTNAASLYYLPFIATGGNGADGYAIVRWFDKTSL